MNRVITDAEAAEALAAEWPVNDLPSVGTEDALKTADLLPAFEIAGLGRAVAADACAMLRTLVSERAALAGRVAELEAERDIARNALQWIAENDWAHPANMVATARAALSTTPESKP